MFPRGSVLCLLAALAGACATTTDGENPAARPWEDGAAAGPAASGSGGGAAPVDPAAGAESAPVAVGPAPRPVAFDGESVWRSATFRRQFIESYLAETDIEPRVTLPEREQVQKILDLLAAENLDGAAELLAKGRTPASSAVFDFLFANVRFQQERFPEAAEAYRAAIAKFPKYRRAWQNLGRIHVRAAEHREALLALTKVIELGGSDAITWGLLGFAHAALDDHLAAESAFRMAGALDPGTLDWKLFLARSLFRQQRFAEASALCDTLIARHPDRAEFWMLQANAFIGLGASDRAAQNFEMVDRLGKSTPESLLTLGDIHVNQELFDPAVDAYLRAMEKQKGEGSPDRFLRAAKALVARQAHGEAERLVAGVESVFGGKMEPPARKELLRIRARLALARGAGDEEAKILEEIVVLDPLDGEALILLGQHRGRIGEADKAVFYYERAAAIEAFEADAKVRHAQLLVGQRRYAEALPLLRRAQALKPREKIQEYLAQVERAAQAK